MSKKDFQYVRKSRDKVIQQNLFADFKKLIIINLFLCTLFFIFSLIASTLSSEFHHIIMFSLVIFAIIAIISNIILIRKLKKAEEKYRIYSEEIIRKAELGQ